MLAPETLLQNRYRIIRKINAGGTSTIYEAMDERLYCQVAVKESSETLQNIDEEVHRMFLNEAAALCAFIHPSLPRVTDYFEESDRLYLVMDFIPGDDLKRLLEVRARAFDVDEVLSWADQLLDALECLHSNNPPILHRDIKPHNLKLRNGKIVLLDFGIAKGALTHISHTSGRSIRAATPMYAPLEQINEQPTDPRSDLYSLAVTLYYLMTNSLPPTAVARAVSLGQKQVDPLLPANQLNPQVPPLVAQILHQAMSVFADDRTASATEIRQALRAATQPIALPTQQPPPAIIQRDKYNIVGWCDGAVTCVAFSPDGKRLAAGSADGIVRVWDIETGDRFFYERVTANISSEVSTLAYSPDGKYVAASSADKFVRVWDLQSKRSQHYFQDYLLARTAPHGSFNRVPIFTKLDINYIELAFSPTNTERLLVVYDTELYYWNFQADQITSSALNKAHTFRCRILPDGKHIALAWQQLDILEIQSGSEYTIYQYGDIDPVMIVELCLCSSLDGKYIATGGSRAEKNQPRRRQILRKGGLSVWEIATGKRLLLEPCDSIVNCIGIALDNKKVATGSDDKKLRIWDLASAKESILGECGHPIIALAYSPDGKCIATGSEDKTVRIWDATI